MTVIILFISFFIIVNPAYGYAENDTIAKEALIGYGTGTTISLTVFAIVGGFKYGLDSTPGTLAMAISYPAASALGVYVYGVVGSGASEKTAALITTFGASYSSFLLPYFFGGKIGKIVAFVLTPLVATAVYNLTFQEPTTEPCGMQTYRPIVNFGFGF